MRIAAPLPPRLTVEVDPALARSPRVQAQAPGSPTALHLQGLAAYWRRDTPAAADCIRRALAVCGRHPDQDNKSQLWIRDSAGSLCMQATATLSARPS